MKTTIKVISKFFSANFLAAPITGKSSINFSRYLRSFKKNLSINYLKFSFTSVKNKNAKITPSKSINALSPNSKKGVKLVTTYE